jgi:hypothetical protein
MDESHYKNVIRIADQVNETVGNESIRNAFDHLEKVYTEALLATPPHKRHDETRYRWQTAILVLRDVRRQLQSVIDNGKIAADRLQSLDTFKKREALW